MILCEEYGHSWVAGMMYVHSEDVWSVYNSRVERGDSPPECERCEHIYDPEVDE